jgi:hypothetical protein
MEPLGCGMCEGWSLKMGTAYRGSVVRLVRIEAAPTWLASINSTYLSELPDRESAMARVAAAITHHMELLLRDTELRARLRDLATQCMQLRYAAGLLN